MPIIVCLDMEGVLTPEEREMVFGAILRASRSAQRRSAAADAAVAGGANPEEALAGADHRILELRSVLPGERAERRQGRAGRAAFTETWAPGAGRPIDLF